MTMMATAVAMMLADELLQMILAPSLTIPHHQFVSSSPAAFGDNDAVSSASVLLVCKRWLRVATPMLYETVIIRSTGQSQALADVFRRNLAFAKHVKKLRLEGSYAFLGDVLPHCKNLVTLVLLLHIYSDANVTGLCRSLTSINPVEVILRDTWTKDNAKVRRVFIALCNAIPTWTNMTSFEYPYGPYDGGAPVDPGSAVPRRDRLVDALAQSKSLRTFHSSISQLTSGQWQRLTGLSSITFKFYYHSIHGLDVDRLKRFTLAKKGNTKIAKTTIEFINLSNVSAASEKPKPSIDDDPIPSFKPFSATAINDDIWSTIFAFVALPGHPNPPDIYCPRFRTSSPVDFNSARKALSLTCKRFQRLVHPLFFTFPLLPSFASLQMFTQKIVKTPSLGSRVRTLTFDVNPYAKPEIGEQMLALLPHLTRLLHFDSSWGRYNKLPMTSEILNLLAEVAGDTLLTLTGFSFSITTPSHPPSLTAFTSFKRLKTLDLPSRGSSPEVDGLKPGSLVNLCTLHVEGSGRLFEALCTLSLPNLKSVSFQCAPDGTVEKLLKKSGSNVEEFKFTGFSDLAQVFNLAPNLLRMEWSPQSFHAKYSMTIDAALDKTAGHEKLERLTFRKIPDRGSGEKEQNSIVDILFDRLDLRNFPSLKEIHFPAYEWPVEERSISRQFLPKKAVEVKQLYGVEIKDGSGKSWRPRAQKRR